MCLKASSLSSATALPRNKARLYTRSVGLIRGSPSYVAIDQLCPARTAGMTTHIATAAVLWDTMPAIACSSRRSFQERIETCGRGLLIGDGDR